MTHIAEEEYPETCLLRQVPGVGPVTALYFRLVIENAQRFQHSRDVGGYLGLVPKQQDSGESAPALRISKAGDEGARRLLVNCAHYIVGPFGPDSDVRRWGLQLAARGGKNARKRAIVAVARKLAVLLHRLLVTGEVYQPLRNSQTATGDGKQRAVAEGTLVERVSNEIRSAVANRRPPRQGDCDRRLGLRGRRRDSSTWKETRDPNLHRAGHGSPRVRMEAGREAENGEHDCGPNSRTLSFSQNLTYGTGFSKTLLRKKNMVERGRNAPPVGRQRRWQKKSAKT